MGLNNRFFRTPELLDVAARHLGSATVIVLALGATACGAQAAQGPEVPGGAQVETPPTGGPGVVTTGEGNQFAQTDAPSSGESASNRPSMTAQAKQAYDAGLSAFQSGDLEGAKTQFSAATSADAKAYQAHFSMGVVNERLGDRAAAQASYRKSISVVSDYEPAIVGLGVLLARSGSVSEAESLLVKHQSQMPKSAAVTAALAEVKSIQGDSTAAQKLAQDALKKNPNYRPAMVTLARDHYRNRRLDLAMEALKGILIGYGEENPPRDANNAEARLLRALILRERGEHGPAQEEFKKALALRADLVEARINLSRYLLEAGNAKDAAPMLEAALRYDKGNVIARLNLGDAYRLLGKSAEAMAMLEWVIKKDSSLAQAHYNLGLLYLFSQNIPGVTKEKALDRAIAQLELFKSKRPRPKPGEPDDTDELITRAKTQKAILAAEKATPPPPAAPPPAAAPAAEGGKT